MKKIFLILIGFICMSCFAYSRGFSGVVFWESNVNDCYETIVKKDYKELLLEKPKSILIPFSKCRKFDSSKLEFYFEEKEIMDSKIQLSDYEKGNSYFSIVINNKIILTGLNRMGYFGAKRLQTDNQNAIYICWIGFDQLRMKLTTNYVSSFNLVLDEIGQKKDLERINSKEIENYFCN